jgi:hypothetical protein
MIHVDTRKSCFTTRQVQITGWRKVEGIKAVVPCPDCHRDIYVCTHAITPDGTLDPILSCPHAGCTFTAIVRLLSWNP